MEKEFLIYIEHHQLFNNSDNILLAVSGGIDSVVMLYLFKKFDFAFDIVHCNFKLRGNESNGDEEFVKKLANSLKVNCYVKHFETKAYAQEKNLSIQMAARELRYNWFENIRKEKNYKYVAVAHNKNDVIETFLINIIRGTGLKGLTGIKPKNNFIIRPLLFAERDEIKKYCTDNNIEFREDSSNLSTKYLRNKIRHEIIPAFIEFNPKFNQTIIDNIQHLTDAQEIYAQAINEFKNNCIEEKEGDIYIEIDKINKNKHLKSTYLFEILREYNFSNKIISDIIQSLKNISGKTFYSRTHRIIKDRNNLIITPFTSSEEHTYYIDEGTKYIYQPLNMHIEILKNSVDFKFDKNKNIGYFDYDKLSFPLIIRKWKKGDYFQPFGMQGLKKLSNYFIDEKFSLIDKEKVWLLASGEKIIWIIGYRTDDRFKITTSSKIIIKISII